jgi:hypothetical protein
MDMHAKTEEFLEEVFSVRSMMSLYSEHKWDNVQDRILLDTVDKFTDWEWFQNLASELFWPRIQINSEEDADTVVRDLLLL